MQIFSCFAFFLVISIHQSLSFVSDNLTNSLSYSPELISFLETGDWDEDFDLEDVETGGPDGALNEEDEEGGDLEDVETGGPDEALNEDEEGSFLEEDEEGSFLEEDEEGSFLEDEEWDNPAFLDEEEETEAALEEGPAAEGEAVGAGNVELAPLEEGNGEVGNLEEDNGEVGNVGPVVEGENVEVGAPEGEGELGTVGEGEPGNVEGPVVEGGDGEVGTLEGEGELGAPEGENAPLLEGGEGATGEGELGELQEEVGDVTEGGEPTPGPLAESFLQDEPKHEGGEAGNDGGHPAGNETGGEGAANGNAGHEGGNGGEKPAEKPAEEKPAEGGNGAANGEEGKGGEATEGDAKGGDNPAGNDGGEKGTEGAANGNAGHEGGNGGEKPAEGGNGEKNVGEVAPHCREHTPESHTEEKVIKAHTGAAHSFLELDGEEEDLEAAVKGDEWETGETADEVGDVFGKELAGGTEGDEKDVEGADDTTDDLGAESDEVEDLVEVCWWCKPWLVFLAGLLVFAIVLKLFYVEQFLTFKGQAFHKLDEMNKSLHARFAKLFKKEDKLLDDTEEATPVVV